MLPGCCKNGLIISKTPLILNDFPTLILGATATALFALILDTLLAWFGRRLSPH
ncbi:putative ABC transporter membrane protein, partial [Salmonella enterica subsp. enterica serovar Enteritidis str. 13183-1]